MKPLDRVFNIGPYPIPGGWNEINNNKQYGLGGNFEVGAGPSTRRVIDFAQPQKSFGINPIGISGHILSPFYKDQVQMFIDGKYRYQLMDEKDIRAAKTHELTLHP
ncbi:Acyl-homoserine lactone acylase QuiP precursor [compost metagenome]